MSFLYSSSTRPCFRTCSVSLLVRISLTESRVDMPLRMVSRSTHISERLMAASPIAWRWDVATSSRITMRSCCIKSSVILLGFCDRGSSPAECILFARRLRVRPAAGALWRGLLFQQRLTPEAADKMGSFEKFGGPCVAKI